LGFSFCWRKTVVFGPYWGRDYFERGIEFFHHWKSTRSGKAAAMSNSSLQSGGFNKGLFCAVMSFSLWGLLPLYWRVLNAVEPMHILACRILLSMLMLVGILTFSKNFVWLTVFKDVKKGGMIIIASLILCINWGVYIWAVNNGRVIEASLGYYINPLVSVVLGLLFFKEKLSRLQWTAFTCACLGVLLLTLLSGALPWISIVLALCFGFYGLIKKTLKISALESLTAETLVAAPVGLFLLLMRVDTSGGLRLIPDLQNLSYFTALGPNVLIPLAFCGIATSLPLYFFGKGAKLLPLSTLGFVQFLAPTLQFAIGVFVFREFFPLHFLAAYSLIWLAAILYITSLRRRAAG